MFGVRVRVRVGVCACMYADRCVGPQAHLANGLFVLGGNQGDLQMRWMLLQRGGGGGAKTRPAR